MNQIFIFEFHLDVQMNSCSLGIQDVLLFSGNMNYAAHYLSLVVAKRAGLTNKMRLTSYN